jgi:hypothetical protein
VSLAKKILLALGILFIAVQFFRPALNKNNEVFATNISKIVATSYTVKAVLINACYDCHSNNTNYPWYSNIQPVGWLMAKHIRKGKDELNFNEFGSYSPRRQLSKLNGIANRIKDNIMPLSSFKMMHKNAILSTYEKELLINWVQQTKDSLSVKK